MNPLISNMTEENNVLKFRLNGVDTSIANGLRRLMLSEIPTVVLRTFPQEKNKAVYEINTSRMNNELIGQRLSCIPLHITDTNFPYKTVELEINKKNNSDTIQFITTEDFKLKDTNTDTYLSQSEVKKIFPPNPITGDYIDLMRLRPRISDDIEGEHIKLTCKLDIGTAQEDSAFNIVSTCAYSATMNLNKAKEAWAAKAAELKKTNTSKEAIDFAEKDWFLLDAKRYFIENSFDFIVETVGPFNNTLILNKACDVMIKKLKNFQTMMQTQEDLIKISECTIENCSDITIPNEGYTLGKVIEYILYTKHYNTTLTYCGFKKQHPHIDVCLIRIAFKEPAEVMNVITYLNDAAENAITIYNKINSYFVTEP
jgi:DNA-directed RNA polymerase alpha subunit